MLLAFLLVCSAFAQTASQTFHFTYIQTPQGRQEMINVLRSIGQMKDAGLDSTGSVTVKGTADQIALATWLVQALDQPAGTQNQATRAYTEAGNPVPEVRVRYTQTTTPQGLQELMNVVRSMTEIQRIVVLNSPAAVLYRGDSGQVALAEWLLGALDKGPSQGGLTADFQVSFQTYDGSNSVRVFYLRPDSTPAEMQALWQSVRSQAHISRILTVAVPKAFAVRGTSDQIAHATRIVQQSKL